MAGTTGTAALRVTADLSSFKGELSKGEKALNLVRDATGRLFRQNGQYVEGLTQAQIKAGLQVDALGQIRDAQFRLIEGLSKTERGLGFYVGELGNVYDAQDRLIRQGAAKIEANRKLEASEKEKARAIEQAAEASRQAAERAEKAKADAIEREIARVMERDLQAYEKRQQAAERAIEIEMEMELRRYEARKQAAEAAEQAAAREAHAATVAEQQQAASLQRSQLLFAKSMRQFASPIMHLTTQIAVLGGANSKTAAQTTAMVSTFMSTIGAAQTMVKGIQGITTATKGATAAQVIYNAVSGNWVAIAAGLVAAGGVAYTFSQIGTEAEKAAGGMDKSSSAASSLSKELQQLQDAALRAGKARFSSEDFFNLHRQPQSGIREEVKKELQYLELRSNLIKKLEMQQERLRTATSKESAAIRKSIGLIGNAIKSAEEGLSGAKTQKLFQNFRESLTSDFEKKRVEINEEIKAFQEVIKSSESSSQDKYEARQAIDILQKRIEEVNQDEIKEAYKPVRDTIAQASSLIDRSLSERDKSIRSFTELISESEKHLKERRFLSEEERDILQKGITAAKASIYELSDIGQLRKEAAEIQRKENEQKKKLDNLQTLIAEGGEDAAHYKKMQEDILKSRLGKYAKYLDETSDETKDFGQRFKTAGEEIVQKMQEANRPFDEVQAVVNRLKNEIQKEALAQVRSQTAGIGMPNAATFQSVEAYKTIAEAKDPSVQAIKSFENAVLAKLDAGFRELSDSYKNGSVGAMP